METGNSTRATLLILGGGLLIGLAMGAIVFIMVGSIYWPIFELITNSNSAIKK